MPDYCENFQALAVQKFTPDMDKRIVVRLRCKMWTCEYCAAKNKAIWRAKLLHHIYHVDCDWSWFTLTAHRYARGEQKSLANLRGAWDSLIKRMKRKYGKFEYARVYEKHADGSYHIHAICSFHFEDIKVRVSRKTKKRTSYSHWLQKTAWELGIGMYTHAENVSRQDFKLEEVEGEITPETKKKLQAGYAASYITKYIVKLDTQTKLELKNVRHIQTSQGWLKAPEFAVSSEFELKHGIYYDDITHSKEHGYRFDMNGYKVDYEDFDETYIFPEDFDHRNLL